MKRFLLMATVLLSISGMAQNKTATTYPVLANPNITDANAVEIDANQLYKNEAVLFSITIVNPSQNEAVKAGSCHLQIELGNKLRLVQKDAIQRIPLPNYFKWSAATDEQGIVWLNGKLIADLPMDFAGITSLELVCIETGSSSIKAQWVSSLDHKKIGSQNGVDFTIRKKKPKE